MSEYMAKANAKIEIDPKTAQEIYNQLVETGIDINAFIEELEQSIKRVENDRKHQTIYERYHIHKFILKTIDGENKYLLERISPEISLWSAIFREDNF